MSDSKVTLYMHAGSGNHGCEAIVRSLTDMLYRDDINGGNTVHADVLTNDRQEDLEYLSEDHCTFIEEKHIADHFISHTLYYIYRKITGDRESFLRYRFRPMVQNPPEVGVSIGGDTYCYESMVEEIMLTNSMLHRQGTKTILLGCSVEPELVKKPDILKDMKLYDRILARESITWKALTDAGVDSGRVELVPDPAFTMTKEELPLPDGWKENDTVGINLSPLISDYAEDKDMAIRCYEGLIRHILDTTDSTVALIPHVVWKRNDDMIPLAALFEKFRDTRRVVLVSDHSAPQLKGFISRCRLFIGARTHATIAAYSTCVPTLVIGYSVKARGIAKDIFGTFDNYVLPVQNLRSAEQLITSYEWLSDNSDNIKDLLRARMPEYIRRAERNGQAVCELVNGHRCGTCEK